MRMILFFLYLLLSFPFNALANTSYQSRSMVVSENRLASQVGVDILRAGGNAIDAAVAVGYALAVVNPCCGNIGGGGFMTIHLANGKNIAVNFREKAPLKAYKKMYLDRKKNVISDQTTKGYLAVAVPGTVLGLDTVLKKYGTMTRQQVLAPAIKLAQEGFTVTAYEANQFSHYTQDFQEQPNVAAIFLKNGHPYKAGDQLIQTDLADTLKLIAKKGAFAFYRGSIAKAIVTASQAHGGKLTLADFADYTIQQSAPIQCEYHTYTLFSAPPPSSGGLTLCTMLQTLEKESLKQSGYDSPESIHHILDAMYKGFIKRNNHASPSKENKSHHNELTDTTHYSILDKQGNAIAVTYTLNGFFGSRVIAGNTGFFLNNEMDDFTVKAGIENKFGLVQSQNNFVGPGKRPLSSMTPTIVMKNGKLIMIVGSPGGPRIITAVLITLLNVMDYDMPLQAAADAPRFHYQGIPDSVDLEPGALPLFTINQLQKLGYHFTTQHTWAAIEAIQIDPMTGDLQGVNDYRRPDGAALSGN
jgi:gamma-glutamyltranspeptidase/glutathione hydrolase